MKKERFEELLASVREGMAIERGEMEPSRVFVVSASPPEVLELRPVVARQPRAGAKAVSGSAKEKSGRRRKR